MMIRSIPPASAHLALRPVPAPPPMIGRPSDTFLRKRARISVRLMTDIATLDSRRVTEAEQRGARRRLAGRLLHQLKQRHRSRVGEVRVVDMFVAEDELCAASGRKGLTHAL